MAGGSAAAGRLVAAGQRVRCRALVLSRDKTPVRTFMTGAYKAATHPEHGWKTAHFWGPVANWGIVGAAVYDATARGPEVRRCHRARRRRSRHRYHCRSRRRAAVAARD